MSGPIVRSGPSEKFTSNWDSVFAAGKAGSKTAAKKSAKAESKTAKAPKKKAKAKTAKKKK